MSESWLDALSGYLSRVLNVNLSTGNLVVIIFGQVTCASMYGIAMLAVKYESVSEIVVGENSVKEQRLRSSSSAVAPIVLGGSDEYHDPLEILTNGMVACDDALPGDLPVVGRFVYPSHGKLRPHTKRQYLAVVPSHNIAAYVRREISSLASDMLFFDPPLTSYGAAQAVLMGRRLTNIRIDKVYSSPLQRNMHFSNLLLAARASSISRVLNRPCVGVLRAGMAKKRLVCDDSFPDVYVNVYTQNAVSEDIVSEHFHSSILKVRVAANMICDVQTGTIGSCTVEAAVATPMLCETGVPANNIVTPRTIQSYSSLRQRSKRQPLLGQQAESFWQEDWPSDEEGKDDDERRQILTRRIEEDDDDEDYDDDEYEEDDDVFFHTPTRSPIDTILSSYWSSLHRASLSPLLRFSPDALQQYVGSLHSIQTSRDVSVSDPKLDEVSDSSSKRNTLAVYASPDLAEQLVGPASVGSKAETLANTWYAAVFSSAMKQPTWWWFPGKEFVAFEEVREQVDRRWAKFLFELHQCVEHILAQSVDVEELKLALLNVQRVSPLPPPPAPPVPGRADSPLGITYTPGQRFVLYSTDTKRRKKGGLSSAVAKDSDNVFTWEDTDLEAPPSAQVVKLHLDDEDDELRTLCSSEAPDSPNSTASFIEDVLELAKQQTEHLEVLQKTGSMGSNLTVLPVLPPMPVLKLPPVVLGTMTIPKPLPGNVAASHAATTVSGTPGFKPMSIPVIPPMPPTFHQFKPLPPFKPTSTSIPPLPELLLPKLDITPLLSSQSSNAVNTLTPLSPLIGASAAAASAMKIKKSPQSVMIAPEPTTPLLYTTIEDTDSQSRKQEFVHHLSQDEDVEDFDDEDFDGEHQVLQNVFDNVIPLSPEKEIPITLEDALHQVLQDSTSTTYTSNEELLQDTQQNLLKNQKSVTTDEFQQYTRSYKHTRKVQREHVRRTQEYNERKEQWNSFSTGKSTLKPTEPLLPFPPAPAPTEPLKHTIHRVDKTLDTIARSSDQGVLLTVHPIWTKLLLAKWCLQGDYVPNVHGGELICVEMVIE